MSAPCAVFSRLFGIYQWFLMELSVLPGRCFDISDHLLPTFECIVIKISSSSFVQGALLMMGSRWLCHRSRHCLPVRSDTWHAVFKLSAIRVQLVVPYCSTRSRMASSSHRAQIFRLRIEWIFKNIRTGRVGVVDSHIIHPQLVVMWMNYINRQINIVVLTYHSSSWWDFP